MNSNRENDRDWHFAQSSSREKLLEHLFVGDLLRWLWQRGVRDAEVLRAEVDAGGYDIAIECNGTLRHIQLKASTRNGKTARQNVNVKLADKPSGCVVWVKFDPETMTLGPFLWFGGAPGERLPTLPLKIGRRSAPNRHGVKPERANITSYRKEGIQIIGGHLRTCSRALWRRVRAENEESAGTGGIPSSYMDS